ncbi:MAG: M15 family metallopeptidase [Firmicutes bacterium]|nr:M15 family metallopeptidase [Bacillota bacterium]
MKKIIGLAAVCAVFAAVFFGVKYIDEYYIGIPKDAVYSDIYSLDAAPDGLVPSWYSRVYSIEQDGVSYDVYAFFAESGNVEQRVCARKDTVADSAVRGMRFPIGTGHGFIKAASTIPDYPKLGAEDIEKLLSDLYFFQGEDPEKPGVPQLMDLYVSDKDVSYRIVSSQGEVAADEDGMITAGEGSSARHYRFCAVKGSRYGKFFPCAADGEITPGTLPSEDLSWECWLTDTDTKLIAEPATQEEQEAKDALIAEHKEARITEEERKAREAAERAARAKAEREAREAAAREAAAKEAAEKAAKEAEIRAALENMTAEEKAQLKEKYSAVSMYLEKNLDSYISYGMWHQDKSASSVVQIINTGIDKPFYTDMKPTDTGKGTLMLVNKYNYLSSGYVPNLTALPKEYGGGYMQSKAAAAFMEMVDAAKADGISLRAVSPYRSYSTQKNTHNYYVRKLGEAAADRESARAGSSEHQTGLAVDINTAETYDHFEKTPEYAWLQKNCAKYGFILRYRQGKEYITGYIFEPWHYRYVGTSYAESIMKSGLTFEEYYAYYIDK